MRHITAMGLRILGLFLLFVVPTALMAQDSTSTSPAPDLPTYVDAVNMLLTLAIGFITPKMMAALERLSSWLTRQPAFTKRAVVSVIPAIVMYGASLLTLAWPAFPWDPTPVNAMIATVMSLSIHAGDTAKEAKQASTQT